MFPSCLEAGELYYRIYDASRRTPIARRRDVAAYPGLIRIPIFLTVIQGLATGTDSPQPRSRTPTDTVAWFLVNTRSGNIQAMHHQTFRASANTSGYPSLSLRWASFDLVNLDLSSGTARLYLRLISQPAASKLLLLSTTPSHSIGRTSNITTEKATQTTAVRTACTSMFGPRLQQRVQAQDLYLCGSMVAASML